MDIAIELSPKVDEEAEFANRATGAVMQRRKRATFGSTFDWVVWPKAEIFHVLRARTRTLSLHEWDQVAGMKGVRYRVLWEILNGSPD